MAPFEYKMNIGLRSNIDGDMGKIAKKPWIKNCNYQILGLSYVLLFWLEDKLWQKAST